MWKGLSLSRVPTARPPRRFETERAPLPVWLASMVLHAVLIVALGLMIRTVPRGADDATIRTGGIVLKYETASGAKFEGESSSRSPREQPPAEKSQAILAALPSADDVPDPSPQLLDRQGQSARGGGPVTNIPGAGQMAAGGRGSGTGATGGGARVQVFGVEGEGRTFVYVFDRSVSMTGQRLALAKAELLRSLESLESTHQFQIVFFNDRQQVFDLSGGQRRMPFATDRAKSLAERFVESITADGGTDRLGALERALRMKADVVFFLTDADDPMSNSDLATLRRKNRGTTVCTIEFGVGARLGRPNFLQRLATQNGGSYVYMDTTAWETR